MAWSCSDRLVFLEVRMDVDPLRAEAVGFLDVHAGTHPEAAGLVAAGGHNPSLVGKGPYDDGLPLQRRIVADLHGRVEGVHVHVYDDASHSTDGLQ